MKKLTFVSGFIYNKESNHSFGGYTELQQNGMITLQEAKEVYNRIANDILANEDEYIKKLEFDLSKKGIRKTALYFPKTNTLRIYKSGLPVYENADGDICRDEAALADSLC